MTNVFVASINYLSSDFLVASSASSENAVYPAANLYDTYTRSRVWRSLGDSDEWLEWDLGMPLNPTLFCACGPLGKPLPLTSGATITLEGNPTNTWTSPACQKTISYHEKALVLSSNTGLHTEPLRYWRFSIADSANPLGFIELSSVFLGTHIATTRGAISFPFSASFLDASEIAYSESGVSLSDAREISEQFTLEWQGLTVSEKEDFADHFTRYGTAKGFFVVLDPASVFSSNVAYYTRFVRFLREPNYRLVSPGNFSMGFDLREEF